MKITPPTDATEIMAQHNQVSGHLIDLIALVCDKSHLMLDPDEDSFYLVDNLCQKLPRLAALIGESSALIAQEHHRKRSHRELLAREIELRALLLDYLRGFSDNLNKAQTATPALKQSLDPAYLALEQEIRLRAAIMARHMNTGIRALAQADPVYSLNVTREFYQQAISSLDQLLQQRMQRLTWQRNLYLGIACLCMLASVLMFIWLYLSIKAQFGGDPFYVQSVIRKIAQGELNTPISVSCGDGSSVLSDIRIMRGRLQETVEQLQSANSDLCHLSEDLEAKVQERTFQLNEALQHAEAAVQAKSQFLATMSHEIRTPMNGILGMAELLSFSQLDAGQQDLIRHLQTSGEVLLTLLNDILDFSKIEAGKLELEQRAFALRAEIQSLAVLHRPQAEAKGLRLRLRLSDTLPEGLMGDSVRLRQIISNLLSNAIKFTEFGHVTLKVSHRELENHRTRLRCAIEDTGIGIASENIPRLFGRFTQHDASTTRRYGGSGLGLAICAQLIKAFHGEIIVKSRLGKGSSFCFYLDLPRVQPPCPQPARVLSNINFTPLSILVAEDSPINQKLIDTMLARVGQRADLAENGKQAVEMALAHHYDLIFMDMQMPVMDGVEATLSIRAQLSGAPRIIALTANAFEEDRLRCLRAGMDDFISKPFKFDELLRILAEVQRYAGNERD
jgi:signal transduction histidine kinase/ActR/RegA family two-component response regulator